MKVGVVTHHWVPNFGANLQAYAVVKSFQDSGHDVSVLNFRPAELENKYQRSVSDAQRNTHADFCSKYFSETELIRSHDEFLAHVESGSYDLLVSGSDAVFRLQPESSRADYKFPNPYWLDLSGTTMKRKPRCITLSVSAMGDHYKGFSKELKRDIKRAVESLDYFSSRDSWTIRQLELCNVDRAMEKSPDPVFYLRDEIEKLSTSADRKDPYIAVSTGNWFGPDWMGRLREIANAEGYRLVALPTPEGKYDQNVNEKIDLPLSPFEWMRLIAESSGYLGARYHPVVVALLAMVPIISTDKYHYSFWDKARSKNFDLMREFRCDKYCIGKLKKKVLSPKTAMGLFLEQQSALQTGKETAEAWTSRYTDIVRRVTLQD